MDIYQVVLILAAFLCSLVAGFLFAFAAVTMPGIRKLNDREFIRAFQVMDRVIQNNQPLFMLVWIGSVIAILVSLVIGVGQLDGAGRLLIILAGLAYLLGVQLPTITINVPLNNKLQKLDADAISEESKKTARQRFEPKWNQWNAIRTIFASLSSILLLVLLFRL